MPKLKKYSVTTTMAEGLKATSQIKEHALIMDQPQVVGGSDTGPTPVDAFLATIGSCLATIARMVAKQRGIHIERMQFTASGELDVEVLLGKSQSGRAGFTYIQVEAEIESPDLDEAATLAFLEEVDRRCPVSETILHGTSLKIALPQSAG